VNSIIGSGIFGLPATVAGLLGKRSVVAVLIAGAATGVILACFAEVASQFSEAGGPYLYARAAFGRLTGILVGWMLTLHRRLLRRRMQVYLSLPGGILAGGEGALAALCDSDVTGGIAGAYHTRGARQGMAVSNVFTVAKFCRC